MSRNPNEIVPNSGESLQLGGCRFDPETEVLIDAKGLPVPLRRQSAAVLAFLARAAGRPVAKSALLDAVWADTHVTEDSLVQCIGDIRRALGDDHRKIVETLPRQGYRLNLSRATAHGRWRWAAAVAAMAVALAALAAALQHRPAESPTVAVLAFADVSPSPDRGYLKDAISEGLLVELSRFPQFKVLSPRSSFRFRDSKASEAEIAAALSADYLLAGSQMKDGEKLRVTVRLTEPATQRTLWAATFDRDMANFFEVEGEIVRRVAATAGGELAHHPVPDRGRAGVSALHDYLEGRAIMVSYTRENASEARTWMQRAIADDPGSAFGYIGMSHLYRDAALWGWNAEGSRNEMLARAAAMADKALELEPRNYLSHYVRARAYEVAGDLEASIAQYRAAAKLNPSASQVMIATASPLLYLGREDEAIDLLNQAKAIDPLADEWLYWQFGWALWQKRDCKGALKSFEHMSAIEPAAHKMLSAIYACLGDAGRARQNMAIFLASSPDQTIASERAAWGKSWKAPGQMERWVADMRYAGMPE